MLRRNVLFFSVILFAVGVILTINTAELQIVSFVNRILNLHLDVAFRSFGLFYCGCLLITLSFMGVLFYLSHKEIISQRRLYFFSSVLLVVFYFFFLWKDAVNIPITDDYRFLIFLNQYVNRHSFSERWQLIMQPPVQNKLTEVSKLYIIGVWEIFGSINFKWLNMVNGCVLLTICALLFKSFNHPPKASAVSSAEPKLLTLAFLFFVLQFQSFDSAFWVAGGISNYWTLFFSMLAIRQAEKDSTGSFLLSLLFAMLAFFTRGNGLIVFPLCCMMLYANGKIKQALIFAFLMVAACIVYFYYRPFPEGVSVLQFNPLSILIYATGFLGSSMQFMYSLYIPVLTGFLCLGIFVFATIKKYYRKHLFTWAVLLFIILSAFIAATFRSEQGPLQSRYGLYSIVAIILCIMIMFEMTVRSKSTKICMVVLTLAVCYNFLSGVMFYPEAPVRKLKLQNFVNDWEKGRPLIYSPPVIPDEAEKYLNDAKKSGIWDDVK